MLQSNFVVGVTLVRCDKTALLCHSEQMSLVSHSFDGESALEPGCIIITSLSALLGMRFGI